MKVTLNHKSLAKAFSYTSRAVSSKPNIPILSNVLLNVDSDKGALKLSATNLDMGINMWIPGNVESAGKTTVNAKYISDFVAAAVSNENITVELKDNNVNVKTAKAKGNFNIIPAEEYPVLPKVGETPIFKISSIEFVKSLEKVIFACSTDLTAGRIQQSGVKFEIDHEKSEIHFIGLDGFRLSKRVCQLKDLASVIEKPEILVPARYLSEFVKIVGDNPGVEFIDVFLSESNSQIIFKLEEIEFSVRLLEGPYPDYKRIMPDGHSYTFEVNKSDLENSIKIVNSFARGNLGNKTLFDFDIESANVKLKSAVSDVGEGEAELTVSNVTAESDLNTAYTLKYLQDLVTHTEGSEIIFETKGPLAATVFRDKNDPQYVHLIMPMRRE
jgi:DNA polymerase-3 subunit beta